jgi:hypothetical protein
MSGGGFGVSGHRALERCFAGRALPVTASMPAVHATT